MTVAPLPEAFIRRIKTQLGADAERYFNAMLQPPRRGLRLNPLKIPQAPLSDSISELGALILWEPDGRYLPLASTAGAHPLHEAGAYYLQEPSAMLPARVLNVKPGETVLDLCAAPGGKSTQLAIAMAGQGTLICNEIVPSRARILSRNLERMGVVNALAVTADPQRLAEVWPLLFDAILVDAPCSGEGMFRRHPEARLEWDAEAPARCALRQRRILERACAMLKPGGRLCYSTCTFSREENEDVVTALLAAHPELTPATFSIPVGDGCVIASHDGCLRLYPHDIEGEGHFTALLRKTGPGSGQLSSTASLLHPAQALNAPEKACVDAFSAFRDETIPGGAPVANAMLGETLLCAPPLPPLAGIRVLRAGLALGRRKGRVFGPDHALALAAPAFAFPLIPLTQTETLAYQRGETLPASANLRGYAVVTFAGLALGFVKAGDELLKNHYPKGLRRMLADSAQR
ncbi:MAG: RsmF rRNA methyltransferase first C-terminal domain-containing protein [Eubacteriales bacterium]|nr:RsmF rRNA methyltransferase first C-terminal domain-containing protein [Eubacteriales bacterium]